MNNFYVYAHINPITNEIFYIGKGSNKRAYSKQYRTKHWNYIVSKYGFKVKFIAKDLSEDKSFEIEKKWINKIGRKDLGLGSLINYSDGGEGPSNPSKETRLKLSKIRKGKKHTAKAKNKIRQKLLGKSLSIETKNKMSKAHLGNKCKEDTKLKIGLANKGKTHSIKTKTHLSKNSAHNKPVKQFDINNNFIKTYYNIMIAEKETGLNHIGRSISKSRPNGGFRWAYA